MIHERNNNNNKNTETIRFERSREWNEEMLSTTEKVVSEASDMSNANTIKLNVDECANNDNKNSNGRNNK